VTLLRPDVIGSFFEEKISDLKCLPDTKSYIIGIFSKYKTAEFDFSQNSITILYSEAKLKNNFLIYQNIADWLLFTSSIAPEHLKHASKDYYNTIARLSYYSCFKLINKQWRCYEEIADNYNYIEYNLRNKLKSTIQFEK
jgi:hypothetical protein